MTQKDFVLIANTIHGLLLDGPAKVHVAERFARVLSDTNPRFEHERFVRACVYGKERI
jgi:hypothetical protein